MKPSPSNDSVGILEERAYANALEVLDRWEHGLECGMVDRDDMSDAEYATAEGKYCDCGVGVARKAARCDLAKIQELEAELETQRQAYSESFSEMAEIIKKQDPKIQELERDIERLAAIDETWTGCGTGDCPHINMQQCVDALVGNLVSVLREDDTLRIENEQQAAQIAELKKAISARDTQRALDVAEIEEQARRIQMLESSDEALIEEQRRHVATYEILGNEIAERGVRIDHNDAEIARLNANVNDALRMVHNCLLPESINNAEFRQEASDWLIAQEGKKATPTPEDSQP